MVLSQRNAEKSIDTESNACVIISLAVIHPNREKKFSGIECSQQFDKKIRLFQRSLEFTEFTYNHFPIRYFSTPVYGPSSNYFRRLFFLIFFNACPTPFRFLDLHHFAATNDPFHDVSINVLDGVGRSQFRPIRQFRSRKVQLN